MVGNFVGVGGRKEEGGGLFLATVESDIYAFLLPQYLGGKRVICAPSHQGSPNRRSGEFTCKDRSGRQALLTYMLDF